MDLFSRTAAAGLYDLRPGTLLFCELSAYEAALSLCGQALRSLETAALPERANRARLDRIAALCGYAVPDNMELSALRAAAAALLRGPGSSSSGLERYFRALGAEITLAERPESRSVTVGGELSGGFFTGAGELLRRIASLLPVGVTAVDDLGSLTWDRIDGSGLTAAGLDESGLTWGRIDAGGPLPDG